jgi:hypothetical protein
MAITLEQAAQDLYANRLMLDNEQISAFEEALTRITSERDFHHIPLLTRALDDATEQYDVMDSVVHAIERYDKFSSPAKATATFIEAIPSLIPQAGEWLDIMLYRILNDDASRQVFAEQLAASSLTVREKVTSVLNKIAAEEPQAFQTKVAEVSQLA